MPIDHLVRNLWDGDFSLDLVARRGFSCDVNRNTAKWKTRDGQLLILIRPFEKEGELRTDLSRT
jgi:hypothetical protein